MSILVTILHIFVCVFLILVILLQAGRGQGLTTSSFGAGAQSFLGTKTTSFMKKLTSICAILFICTSLVLVILSIRSNRSVFSDYSQTLPAHLPVQTPLTKTTTTTTTTVPTTNTTPTPAVAPTTPSAPSSSAEAAKKAQ